MLIILALLVTQWAGMSHRIEHWEQLQAESIHNDSKTQQSAQQSTNELLHSCLLFDGLTTAQLAVSDPLANWHFPVLARQILSLIVLDSPRNALFAQRVRVRGPPVFS